MWLRHSTASNLAPAREVQEFEEEHGFPKKLKLHFPVGSLPWGASPPINFPEFTPDSSRSSFWHLFLRTPPSPLHSHCYFHSRLGMSMQPPNWPLPSSLPASTQPHLPKRSLCSGACPSQEPSMAPVVQVLPLSSQDRPDLDPGYPSNLISLTLYEFFLFHFSNPALLSRLAQTDSPTIPATVPPSLQLSLCLKEGKKKKHAVKPQSRIFSTSSQGIVGAWWTNVSDDWCSCWVNKSNHSRWVWRHGTQSRLIYFQIALMSQALAESNKGRDLNSHSPKSSHLPTIPEIPNKVRTFCSSVCVQSPSKEAGECLTAAGTLRPCQASV